MVSRMQVLHGIKKVAFMWQKMFLYRFGFIDLKPLLLDILLSKTYYKSTSVMVFIPYNIFDFFQFPGLAWHTKWHLYMVKVVYMMVLSI